MDAEIIHGFVSVGDGSSGGLAHLADATRLRRVRRDSCALSPGCVCW